MKNTTLFYLSLFFVIAASCRKSEVVQPNERVLNDEVTLNDSISFIIDGKQYAFNEVSSQVIGNREANKRIDKKSSDGREFSVDNDTLLFSREITFSGSDGAITLYFVKKFAKTDLNYTNVLGTFATLKSVTQLISIGAYAYPIDFNRDNSHNGVAIGFLQFKERRAITTFDISVFGRQNILNENSQANSEFKIVKLKQLKTGGYVFEGIFNTNLFMKDSSVPITLHNGYVRIKMGRFL